MLPVSCHYTYEDVAEHIGVDATTIIIMNNGPVVRIHGMPKTTTTYRSRSCSARGRRLEVDAATQSSFD